MDCAVFTASSREDPTCPPTTVGLVGALLEGGRCGVTSVDTEITDQAKTATRQRPRRRRAHASGTCEGR
jgi:hypothetical protein